MFTAEIMVTKAQSSAQVLAGQRRKAARAPIEMVARVGEIGARSLCRVIDLSVSGARLTTYAELEPQTVVLLTLPGQPPRRARIVWSEDYMAGCAFEAPLTQGAIDDLVSRYGFTPAMPEVAMFRPE